MYPSLQPFVCMYVCIYMYIYCVMHNAPWRERRGIAWDKCDIQYDSSHGWLRAIHEAWFPQVRLWINKLAGEIASNFERRVARELHNAPFLRNAGLRIPESRIDIYQPRLRDLLSDYRIAIPRALQSATRTIHIMMIIVIVHVLLKRDKQKKKNKAIDNARVKKITEINVI